MTADKNKSVRPEKDSVVKESLWLFWSCAGFHLLLMAGFLQLNMGVIAGLNAVCTLLYLLGIMKIHTLGQATKWMYMFVWEFVLSSIICTYLVGWGYGFALYGLMIIPTIFYFSYLFYENSKPHTAMIVSVIVGFLLVTSCQVTMHFNRLEWMREMAVLRIFMLNMIFCIYVLAYYSYRFMQEIYKKTARLKYRANYDMVTGVWNRENFLEKAADMIKSNPNTQYCIVCSDIKDFKMINDLYGDEKGNEVLKKQAEIIIGAVKKDGVIYGRIGGDKFAMCIPRARYNEDFFVGKIKEMSKTFSTEYYHMYVYMGVYFVEDIDEPVGTMCDKAFMAINNIKGDYHQIVAYYDQSVIDKEFNKKQLIAEFDKAIEEEQFCIFLQPQTNGDGSCRGAEALVRWNHPERGLMFPDSFVGCYEEAGLIYKLDVFVWELAARQLKMWQDMGRNDLHISVNISPMDFYYLDVYKTITDLVEKYGISKKNFRLELTETAIVTEESNTKTISRLHDAGFIIEIDDFGSGYSSLNTLKDISADVVKIDREFLKETQNVEKSKDILEVIIGLSNRMNMLVITEGVETREQVDMLSAMGCSVFQGYYFSKPIPVADFEMKYNIR